MTHACEVLRLECQCSPIVSNELCQLFREGILKNLRLFHWIPREKDKSTEIGEKTWIRICDAIRETPPLNLVSLCIPNNSIGEKGCKELVKLGFDTCLREIKELNLSGNRIGSIGSLELIRAMKIADTASRIMILDLSNNGIAQRGMKLAHDYLMQSEYPLIEELRMGGTRRMQSSLVGNMIDKLTMQRFLDVLSYHALPSLKILDLSRCPYEDE